MLSLLAFAAATLGGTADLTKPVAPQMMTLSAADCEDKATRDQKLRTLGDSQAWSNDMQSFAKDWVAYIESRLDQLGLKGAERRAFLDKVSQKPEFIAIMNRMDGLMAKVQNQAASLEKLDDEVTACKAVGQMLDTVPELIGIMTELMELTDSEIEAEAKRRGIKLD